MKLRKENTSGMEGNRDMHPCVRSLRAEETAMIRAMTAAFQSA
jgi:hypothetical protein